MIDTIKTTAIKIQRVIFVTAMGFMLVALAANVFMRYTLGKPLIWSEEVTALMQGGIAFLGIGYCFARGKHIELTLLYDHLPRRLQLVCDLVTRGIMVFCLYYLIQAALVLVSRQMIPLGTVTWLRIGYFYAMVPVGLIVGGIYILAEMVETARRLFAPGHSGDAAERGH